LFQPLDVMVGLKLWIIRSTTTPPIGLLKNLEKCAFQNPIHGLFAATLVSNDV